MAYSTLGWQNGQAPAINASNLNHMDQGIADADAAATAAATLAGQKMDKVSGGTDGDFAALDENGNVVDSGKSASDFAPSSETGYVVRQTTTSSTPRAYTYSRDGGDSYLPVIRAESTPKSIVQRTVGGQIVTGNPTDDIHAATKKYVDDRVQANPTGTATTDLTKLKVGDTTYNIPSGGGSAGVSSIGGATGAITLGTGMSMSGQTLNGPDLSGFVEKQTTTSGSWRVYAFSKDGDSYLKVTSGLDGTTAPTETGNVITNTSGRIRTNTPTGPYHAANKQYVDDNFAPKATNGYATLDANGAVQGLKDVFVDFGNIAITAASATIGQKLYNALAKYGFAITTGGIHSTGVDNPGMPNQIITPYSSTTSSFNFRVQYIGTGGTNILVDTTTFYVVDNTGSIVQDT